ncbi:MAG: Fe-S cluster assembly ATPase SufC [Chitinophagales bacterium]|jgi:Fe-S cluster assembly ATP-binding protein|nr:Fe-S cluster assembly ATPase SufC [Chitinophagales bacterium]
MLSIQNLHTKIGDKEILKGLNLQINKGEVHAIMGPNGTGKSTLAYTLAGKDQYENTAGDILFENQSILELDPTERAHLGLFLCYQYPVEIPGVSTINFMKTAINEMRKAKGQEKMEAKEFLELIRTKAEIVELNKEFLTRAINDGFSGGEKKRNEIFQLAMLEPKLAVLDETDSGLDIDALRIVANGVNQLRNSENAFLVITHYQRLLDYIIPDFVHIMYDGRIIKTGDKNLALELEEKGYNWVKELA